jgi:ABC-type nitrate/sulfonate/bicarbonate transport system permease component
MKGSFSEQILIGAATLAIFLVAWEFCADTHLINPLFISSPSRVARVGAVLIFDPDFWNDVSVSASEFAFGYIAAAVIGIPLGLAMGTSRRLSYLLNPFVDTFNVVPRVTLLPLLVIWFGIGIWSKVAVVFLGAVVPIVISGRSGVKTNEARFLAMARSFSASRVKMFTSIMLPGTVPYIFTGLKYAAGRALLGVVVGELYAATAGVGHLIADAGNLFQTDTLFFGVFIFTATGLVIVAVLDRLERRFERWRPKLGATP